MDSSARIAADGERAGGENLVEQVHRQAVHTPVKEAVALLQALLARRVVAYVAGVKDVKTITRWANGDVETLRPESEMRVRTAYEIITLLYRFDAPETVRAWFLGMCPQLDDVSPAQAIHDGRLQEAMTAARSFAAYG